MEWSTDLLKKADFSRETDLKERLRRQLFGEQKDTGRETLGDEALEQVTAAGNPGCVTARAGNPFEEEHRK